MFRSLILLMAFTLFSISSMAQTNSENRAVRISMMGGIAGFDEPAYRALMASVGRLIADGIIGKYQIESYGLEGGSAFCAELVPYPHAVMEKVVAQLSAVRPRENTVYSFEEIEKCE